MYKYTCVIALGGTIITIIKIFCSSYCHRKTNRFLKPKDRLEWLMVTLNLLLPSHPETQVIVNLYHFI